MKFFRSKRGLAVLAALLLVLFLFRPGVYRLRNRIAGTIGSALGRHVSIDNVRVHALPRPGFDLEGVVISDDPAFSAEPMIRAQEITAAIRLRALFRGRIEIATLNATEPSINLVRSPEGHWNLSSLLQRSTEAPTRAGEARAILAPAFPYLEATHARINFKLGQEKKAWSLTDADVALWQESDGSWGARMTAQPTRTDLNLTDTGLVQVDAAWRRPAKTGEAPVQVTIGWKKGQLGQITKLFSGRDRGWRGDVNFGATLKGSPSALRIQSQLRIEDFRRYDVVSSGSVPLATTCSGTYQLPDSRLDDLDCQSPVAGGTVRVSGDLRFVPGNPVYQLTLAADKVPLSSALQLLRKSKKGVPDNLTAAGHLDGEFRAAKTETTGLRINGKGAATGVHLVAKDGKDQIIASEVPFSIVNDGSRGRTNLISVATKNAEPVGTHLRIGPFPLNLGGTAPVTAGGWLSSSDYRFFLRGDTEVRSLYRFANMVEAQKFRPVMEGSARFDIGIAGSWQGFAAPAVSGGAQLRNSRAGVRGLNPAIEITSAQVKFDPETVTVENISATVGKTHWTGSMKAPRQCAAEPCAIQFDLAADRVSSGELFEWFTPRPAKRPWYRILGDDAQKKSPLLTFQANGKLSLARLALKKIDCTQVAAQVAIDGGKITLSNVQAQLLDGTHQGRWVIDASTQPPQYHGSGTLQSVSLTELSTAMGDPWVTGTADAKFDLSASGGSFSELLASADGEGKFAMQNGAFAHLELPEPAKPFPVHLFAARIAVKKGVWDLSAGRIESRDGIYQISGTASPGGGLNLILKRADEQSWNVTGTLLKPRLVHGARTEARSVVQP